VVCVLFGGTGSDTPCPGNSRSSAEGAGGPGGPRWPEGHAPRLGGREVRAMCAEKVLEDALKVPELAERVGSGVGEKEGE